MALKDINQAGTFGGQIAGLCKTANGVANQYASAAGPLPQIIAAYGLTCSIPDDTANQAAIATLLASVVLPTSDQYAAASSGRFTQAEIDDSNAIFGPLQVALYVLAKMQSRLPMNDI